jgi:hypothetical protein
VVCTSSGRALISSNVFPEYEYGDELRIKGTMKKPGIIENFNYQGYLLKDKITAYMSFPNIEIIGKDKGGVVMSSILSFKKKMALETKSN